jgi:hypothetical protein
MPDDITADAGEHTEQTESESQYKAPASQEELDRIIQARLDRERKKLPTDYEELKAKAQKFAEWEEANKTEAQKTADRLAAIERENAELKTGKLRADVANAKGVPAVLLTGRTQEELEAAADALIAFRGEQKPAGPSSSSLNRVNTNTVKGSTGDQFADFFTSKLSS